MKRQSKASRLDESLGVRRGKESSKSQSYKSRRDESKGASKKKSPAKKSPVKKALKHLKEDMAGYKKERKHLKKEIKEDKDLSKTLKRAAKPKSMGRYKDFSAKEMKEHMAAEKKVLKRKKK